ncbi:MAG: phosphoribosylglycinamide formyltransferase [Sedimentisphaerales bacterium]|nr:phosphoribosylglycinamide formyltransferase [Sedimentisphaerales bacterium]
MPDEIIAHIDGGSRGNPGPAAAGFVLTDRDGTPLLAKAFFLGRTTNNVAEYTSVIKALEGAGPLGAKRLSVFSDSELLVKQINGEYKVKSEQIRPLYQEAVHLLDQFKSWSVRHVPREKNKEADRLVNQALDLGHDFEDKPVPDKPQSPPIRLGVLISGGGTTLINILEKIEQGSLNAKVVVVISSRSTVKGVERAKNAGLDVKIIRKKDYPDMDEFSKHIENELAAAHVDLVVQGGWLCLWKIPARYENRVMNIHPALLPSFGGKGMWGHHVHEAVLKAGCKVSGCTVHFCTNEYDDGPIIVQRTCEARHDDTPDTLAARVFEQECIAYPQAIRLFAEGRLTVQNGVTHIKA